MCCLQERVFASPRKTRARARIFRFFSPFFCSFPFATCLPPPLATRKNVEEKGLLRRKKDATFENAERTRERVVRYHSHSFPLSHFIFLRRASSPPPITNARARPHHAEKKRKRETRTNVKNVRRATTRTFFAPTRSIERCILCTYTKRCHFQRYLLLMLLMLLVCHTANVSYKTDDSSRVWTLSFFSFF